MASSTTAAKKLSKSSPEQPVIGRRERSKLEKRARITAAARALFEQQGFAATTTQQIADAADIGTGTLFLYAKTKEDLLLLVFKDEMTANARESFLGLPKKATVVDQIMYVFENMIAYHERDLEMAVSLHREIVIPRTPERFEDLQDLLNTIFGGLESIVKTAQEAKCISQKLDARQVAQSIFSIYLGGLLSWLGRRQTREQFIGDLRTRLEIFSI